MGDGQVLESGTHNYLLQADGAYARLVQAQKLREATKGNADDASDAGSSEGEATEKVAREEFPLDRSNTTQSLASEILEQKRKAALAAGQTRDDFSIFYLFKRMAPLIRDQWRNYLLGSLAACSRCFSNKFRCFD
jgi:ATP-binding cassette subfamily B (MDR/TAP) protein 1